MYGVINHSIRQLVLDKFDLAAWEGIVEAAGMPKDVSWVLSEYYPDSVTVSLVVAASEKLGVDAGTVLGIYGGYFISYLKKNSLDKKLHIMGDNLKDFLHNLDYLHGHLQDTFGNADFPHFHVTDGDAPGVFTLTYVSSRGSLLAPMVVGLVQEVSRTLFDEEVEMTTENTEKGATFVIKKAGNKEHAAAQSADLQGLAQLQSQLDSFELGAQAAVGFDKKFFLKCWPYYMLMDREMTVIACGASLTDKVPGVKTGVKFSDYFKIVRPVSSSSAEFDCVADHSNVTFKVEALSSVEGRRPIALRGAMHKQGDQLLYLCSLHIFNVNDLLELKGHITDLPLHDSARDLLLMSESRAAEAALNRRLDNLVMELAEERKRSDELLYSMLPEPIVFDLKEGRRARGSELEAVTILFSDIVGFTDLSSSCKPQRVCTMLDELYTVFDTISGFFDVYKVETIGDAYMIAGGIVGDVTKHASEICDMAFAMHAGARLVRTPHNGEPIRIRVGIHSGPATTGVVGIKMPRFCFFGDTVNTASRMESNGTQGMIHLSDKTAELVMDEGYACESRGEIEIKGKGLMETYWLKEHPLARKQVIKDALKASKIALEQLRAYRLTEESTSSDASIEDSASSEARAQRMADTAAKKKRLRNPPVWSKYHEAGRNQHVTEEEVSQVNKAIERVGSGGLKRAPSADRIVETCGGAYLSSEDDSAEGIAISSEDGASRCESSGSNASSEETSRMRARRDATKPARKVSPSRRRGQDRKPLAPNPVPDAAESLRLLSEAISGPAPQPSRSGQALPLNKVTTPMDDFHGPWGMGTSVPVYMPGGVDSTNLDQEKKAAIFMEGLAEAAGPGKCPFGFDKLAKEADKVIKKKDEAKSSGPESDV